MDGTNGTGWTGRPQPQPRPQRHQPPIAVQICREPGCDDLPLPEYHSAGAAGLDLRAAVAEPLTIRRGAAALVPAGIRIALPLGTEAQVRPRSGLALRYGVTVLNSPGTIDSDYRGPVGVILCNHGPEDFVVHRGDRIAQMVVARVERIEWAEVAEVDETTRGDGGFGHTGHK